LLRLRTVLLGAVVLALLVLGAVLVDADVFDWLGAQARSQGYLTAYLVLYVEESGVPLPAPGDVFMLYTGAHVPHEPLLLIAAWAGFVVVVVAGSSNLYWISRRLGRNILDSRLARIIHLTPERMERAEEWFARYGLLAIIFGRHVPGFRIPITVACGVLHVRYPVFAIGVALSTAVWAGFWISIGALYGRRAETFVTSHAWVFWLIGGAIVIGFAAYLGRRWWVTR